jgi:type IV pilus assembly protein PilA
MRVNAAKEKGFTLIELMIVVAIIGILAAIAIPNFLAYQKKAITSEAKQELANIMTLEMAYNADDLVYGSLASVGWGAPTGKTRYTYSLSYSTTTFLAKATGNIDGDATIDEWKTNGPLTRTTPSPTARTTFRTDEHYPSDSECSDS